jgi:hypothetical protein
VPWGAPHLIATRRSLLQGTGTQANTGRDPGVVGASSRLRFCSGIARLSEKSPRVLNEKDSRVE